MCMCLCLSAGMLDIQHCQLYRQTHCCVYDCVLSVQDRRRTQDTQFLFVSGVTGSP
jgi:hypothetical protein